MQEKTRSTGHEQFQTVPHTLGAVGHVTDPFDDLIQEHHIDWRPFLFQLEQLGAQLDLQVVSVMFDGVELIELTNLLCIVQRPWVVDPLVVRFGDKSMLEFMRGNFHDTEPIPGWGYSYGQRIFDYDGFDQLERVVGLLREKPEAKSATITLGRPGGDSGHQPCINVLDFKLRGGLLQIGCFFRSQDVGKKLFADVISLGEIGQMVAARVGCRPGPLVQVSCSSHIYGEDVERVKQLLASAGFGENG